MRVDPGQGGIDMAMRIEGVKRLERKLGDKKLLGVGIRRLLNKASLLLTRRVKEYSPVDTGRLKGSWAHQIEDGIFPTWAKVGTVVEYAIFVEYGGGKPRGGGRIPFFRPAISDLKEKLSALINEAQNLIRKHWGKP